MALVVKDRVKETTATTGTGTLTLAGAVSGFQSFTSALSDGDTTYYAIFEISTGEFEVGLGTFTASGTTLARTTILESSNAGSAINLTAGAADVFITQPAEKAVYLDASGYIATADGRNLTNVTASGVDADSVALGTDTTGNYVQQGATSGNGISGSVNSEGGTFTVTSNATNANTASTIVFRDGSGNFSAGTITANLTGTASQATNADTVDSLHASQFLRSDASDSTSGDLTISGGQVYVGVNDSVAGELILYGAGTGTTEGAEIRLHASADYDGVIDLWSIDVNQDDLRMFTSAGDLAFVARPDAQVELYYNGSKKFETTSGGISVTGTVGATTVDFGDWTITESGGSLYFATGGTNKMKLDASGNLDVVGDVNTNATIT